MKAVGTLIWTVMGTLLYVAAAATTKYTNRPLNGLYCNASSYENLTDVSQHQCLHRCLSNSKCAALSYNPVGLYCLLRSDPCPSAKLQPDFMLMVFTETERRDCISWIPGNEEYTITRLLKATVGLPFRVGRLYEGDSQITGFVMASQSAGAYGELYIADPNSMRVRSVLEYDVLLVSPSCTLAWVPYKAGDDLPDGAQQTGVLDGVAVYSIMVPESVFQIFGFYIVGTVVGYYSWAGDFHTTDNMYLLVHV